MQSDAQDGLHGFMTYPCQHCSKLLRWEQRLPELGLWVAEDGTCACMPGRLGEHPSNALPHTPMPQIGADRGR